jgi:DNA adenine methylase
VKLNGVREQDTASATLKWVGGKRRIADQIVSHFPENYGKYFEPFLGGGSVFFKARPKKAHLTDLNASLVNYYLHLRDDVTGLMREAQSLQRAFCKLEEHEEKKSFYLTLRSKYNRDLSKSSLKNAAQFLFLNKTAFNGLYRENAKGEFNVPFNNSESLNLFQREQFVDSSIMLKGATIQVSDFRQAVQKAKSGDLVYFDPPYVPVSATASFTDYTKSAFGNTSQTALRDLARELRSRGVYVVLSNSYSEIVADLYDGFELQEISVNRLVAAESSSRGKAREYLIIGRPE